MGEIVIEQDLIRMQPEQCYKGIQEAKDATGKTLLCDTADPSRFLDYAEKLKAEGFQIKYKIRLSPCQDYLVPFAGCPALPTFDSRLEHLVKLAEIVGRDEMIWSFAPLFVCSGTAFPTEQALAREFIQVHQKIYNKCSQIEVCLFSSIPDELIADTTVRQNRRNMDPGLIRETFMSVLIDHLSEEQLKKMTFVYNTVVVKGEG